MNIALVSSAYPPELDGIGDHTYWLAHSLANRSNVEVFTRRAGPFDSDNKVKITPFFSPAEPSSFELLHDAIGSWQQPTHAAQWLLLQYNPFGFGKRGWCPWVPQTLRRIRSQHPHLRVATMFHETMVPAWPWKFAVMHLWQSRLFRQVCRLSDLAFVSTTRWRPQVSRAHPRLPCHHLPVGSNIPLDETPHAAARKKLDLPEKALVLGIFGSAHISRQLDWIAAAARDVGKTGRQVIVAHVGPDTAKIAQAMPNLQVRSFGELPANQVGMHLRAMDVLIAPFSDGVSTRRGSVMAGLQHGLPVITTAKPWSDRILIDADHEGLLALSCDDAASFAAMTAERMPGLLSAKDISQRASQFYHNQFAWDTIAEKLTGHLTACCHPNFISNDENAHSDAFGLVPWRR